METKYNTEIHPLFLGLKSLHILLPDLLRPILDYVGFGFTLSDALTWPQASLFFAPQSWLAERAFNRQEFAQVSSVEYPMLHQRPPKFERCWIMIHHHNEDHGIQLEYDFSGPIALASSVSNHFSIPEPDVLDLHLMVFLLSVEHQTFSRQMVHRLWFAYIITFMKNGDQEGLFRFASFLMRAEGVNIGLISVFLFWALLERRDNPSDYRLIAWHQALHSDICHPTHLVTDVLDDNKIADPRTIEAFLDALSPEVAKWYNLSHESIMRTRVHFSQGWEKYFSPRDHTPTKCPRDKARSLRPIPFLLSSKKNQ